MLPQKHEEHEHPPPRQRAGGQHGGSSNSTREQATAAAAAAARAWWKPAAREEKNKRLLVPLFHAPSPPGSSAPLFPHWMFLSFHPPLPASLACFTRQPSGPRPLPVRPGLSCHLILAASFVGSVWQRRPVGEWVVSASETQAPPRQWQELCPALFNSGWGPCLFIPRQSGLAADGPRLCAWDGPL